MVSNLPDRRLRRTGIIKGVVIARNIGREYRLDMKKIEKSVDQQDGHRLIEKYKQKFEKADRLIENFDSTLLDHDHLQQNDVSELKNMMESKSIGINKGPESSDIKTSLDYYERMFSETAIWFQEKSRNSDFCSKVFLTMRKANKELNRVIKSLV